MCTAPFMSHETSQHLPSHPRCIFGSPAARHPGTRQLPSAALSCGEPSQAPGPSSLGARL